MFLHDDVSSRWRCLTQWRKRVKPQLTAPNITDFGFNGQNNMYVICTVNVEFEFPITHMWILSANSRANRWGALKARGLG